VVLDEATSALDSKTESLVTEAIGQLKGELSLVVIAHRLSTIKDFDNILYFEDGKIKGSGNFSKLASDFPDIAEQAQLMKL
jgi:ABC-type multidrug transport system fused ATPase/permease subunit